MKRQDNYYVADRRLYLNKDKSKIVEASDPDASFLYAAPGDLIPASMVDDSGVDRAETAEKPKSVQKISNKQARKSDDK